MKRRTSRKLRKNSRRRTSLRRNPGRKVGLRNLTDALISNVKAMTARNQHTAAVLALSYAVGLPDAVKDAREIALKQLRLGHLSHTDALHLDAVRNALLAVVKSRTNADYYKRLHAAF